MNVRNLIVLNAVLGAASGLALLVIPDGFVAPFGVTLDTPGVMFARMYGAGLLGFAVTSWIARDLGSAGRRAVGAGSLTIWVVFTVLITLAFAGGVVGSMAVVWVVLGVAMTLAFAGAVAGVVVREASAG